MPISWKELQQRMAKMQEEERPLTDRVRDILRSHPDAAFRADEVHAHLRGCGWSTESAKTAQQQVLRDILLNHLVVSDALVASATKQESLLSQVEKALKDLVSAEPENVVTDGTHYAYHASVR